MNQRERNDQRYIIKKVCPITRIYDCKNYGCNDC